MRQAVLATEGSAGSMYLRGRTGAGDVLLANALPLQAPASFLNKPLPTCACHVPCPDPSAAQLAC